MALLQFQGMLDEVRPKSRTSTINIMLFFFVCFFVFFVFFKKINITTKTMSSFIFTSLVVLNARDQVEGHRGEWLAVDPG